MPAADVPLSQPRPQTLTEAWAALDALQRLGAQLQARNASPEARVAALAAQLRQNSTKSSRPPSSDAVADDGRALVRAEDDPDRRVLVRVGQLALVVVDVHLHLAQILVRQLADLQVDQDETARQAVVKYQVDEVVRRIQREALLAGHEGKAPAQLQQEGLQLVDQPLFQVTLQVALALGQAGELQNVGIFYQVGGLVNLVTLFGQGQHALLVPAQGEPLEQERVNLALQFARGPAGVDRFRLVEGSRRGFVHAEEDAVVRPGPLSTHGVDFRLGKVERLHMKEVRAIETLAKLSRQPPGQFHDEPLAVVGAFGPVLLFLNIWFGRFPSRQRPSRC